MCGINTINEGKSDWSLDDSFLIMKMYIRKGEKQ